LDELDHLAERTKTVGRNIDARQLGYRNVEQAVAAMATVAERFERMKLQSIVDGWIGTPAWADTFRSIAMTKDH
jgi:hypothetical protein